MPQLLQSRDLEIYIDQPDEGYNFSRFDWTGKIAMVKFRDIPVSTSERTDSTDSSHFGKGLYNEFGIDAALGFQETNKGEWFHKIGVGALRKQTSDYRFDYPYEIRPAEFTVDAQNERITIGCSSEMLNGYGYELEKEFQVHDNDLTIKYELKNTGAKDIVTEEYVHNFLGISGQKIDEAYILKLPFEIKPDAFREAVNTEKKVVLGKKEIGFTGSPQEQFFFSHLNGDQTVRASWELEHVKRNIGIRETVSFKSKKINLWGWKHVISPEIFHHIYLEPGNSTQWSRTYEFYQLE